MRDEAVANEWQGVSLRPTQASRLGTLKQKMLDGSMTRQSPKLLDAQEEVIAWRRLVEG